MKLNNIYLKVFCILFGGVFFSSCEKQPYEIKPSRQWTTTHSINGLIEEFASKTGDLPTRNELFTVDTIPANKNIVINGVVVSDDSQGNIYKYMVIQDLVTGTALKISVDANNISSLIPVGRAISINCSGLAIGKYADMLQLGIFNYNTDPGKEGYEIGRIPYSIFMNRIQINETSIIPVSDYIETASIWDIQNSPEYYIGKLVKIEDAYFTGKGEVNFSTIDLDENSKFLGRPKPGITGVPISREISDGSGTIKIATSEFARFAAMPLPDSTLKGDITVIVGWYIDKPINYDGDHWQLTLRSLNDLGKGFEPYHREIN